MWGDFSTLNIHINFMDSVIHTLNVKFIAVGIQMKCFWIVIEVHIIAGGVKRFYSDM